MAVRQFFELDGQVALVTGGSRGLGLADRPALGEMGAKVALAARSKEELEHASAKLRADGIEAFPAPCDLSKPEHVPALVEHVLERFGRIDILVNNAGTSWGSPAEELRSRRGTKSCGSMPAASFSSANWWRTAASFRGGRETSSSSHPIAALRTDAHIKAVSYYASKGAVLQLTRALATEWGPLGIRVNAICPGFFPSKMSTRPPEKIGDSVIAHTPLGRLGNDTDLMGAAVYLASAASRHVTGQYIAVDGGASIA